VNRQSSYANAPADAVVNTTLRCKDIRIDQVPLPSRVSSKAQIRNLIFLRAPLCLCVFYVYKLNKANHSTGVLWTRDIRRIQHKDHNVYK